MKSWSCLVLFGSISTGMSFHLLFPNSSHNTKKIRIFSCVGKFDSRGIPQCSQSEKTIHLLSTAERLTLLLTSTWHHILVILTFEFTLLAPLQTTVFLQLADLTRSFATFLACFLVAFTLPLELKKKDNEDDCCHDRSSFSTKSCYRPGPCLSVEVIGRQYSLLFSKSSRLWKLDRQDPSWLQKAAWWQAGLAPRRSGDQNLFPTWEYLVLQDPWRLLRYSCVWKYRFEFSSQAVSTSSWCLRDVQQWYGDVQRQVELCIQGQ